MEKGTKDKLARSPGGDETKGKTQERMERRNRKRSSNTRSEEVERVGNREEKMAGHCSTGQGPQQTLVLMEEEGCHILY